MLLSMVRARGSAAGALCTTVEGTVSPGEEVAVDGERVHVEANGRFRHPVPRQTGRSKAHVVIRAVSGAAREKDYPCAPTKADETELDVKAQFK